MGCGDISKKKGGESKQKETENILAKRKQVVAHLPDLITIYCWIPGCTQLAVGKRSESGYVDRCATNFP